MADPVLPGAYRIQMILKGGTNLPEDDTMNSIVVLDQEPAGGLENVADRAATYMSDFFQLVHVAPPGAPSNNNRIANYIPAALVAPVDPARVQVYDLGQPPGLRFPAIRTVTGIVFSTVGTALPEETACVLTTVAAQSTPRRRGRLFLGPLNSTGLAVAAGRTFIGGNLYGSVRAAGHRLTTPLYGLQLAVLSQMDMVARPVTGGWVDDSFDTMRSRGPKPSTRGRFGEYVG